MNNNIKEAYCSFKVSKLLKENGFDCPTIFVGENLNIHIGKEIVQEKDWDKAGCELKYHYNSHYGKTNTNVSRPTHQMAIEWIRINFNIYITAKLNHRKKYYWALDDVGDTSYEFNSPQEAIESALSYILKNLITNNHIE